MGWVLFKSPAVPDNSGRGMVDLVPQFDALKKKLEVSCTVESLGTFRVNLSMEGIKYAFMLSRMPAGAPSCASARSLPFRNRPPTAGMIVASTLIALNVFFAVITSRDDTVIPVRDFAGLTVRGSVLACDVTDAAAVERAQVEREGTDGTRHGKSHSRAPVDKKLHDIAMMAGVL